MIDAPRCAPLVGAGSITDQSVNFHNAQCLVHRDEEAFMKKPMATRRWAMGLECRDASIWARVKFSSSVLVFLAAWLPRLVALEAL